MPPTDHPQRTSCTHVAPSDEVAARTLLDGLRSDNGWLPALALVAVEPSAEEVIGHVVYPRECRGPPCAGAGSARGTA